MVAFGLRLAAGLAVSAAGAYAAPPSAALLDSRATPALPSEDAFYVVPPGLDKVAPGTILKHRQPPNLIAAFAFAPVNLEASYQILYRTTDNVGNATATVVTVLVPHNADMSKILSYQVAEDAASIDCAPSYAFQLEHATGPDMGTLITEAELLLVEIALEQGWVVAVPDFLGPNGAFLVNKLAGYATLDGIRAAINSASFTGISRDPNVAMWGYSGGSLASLWAAELQPTYAPELRIVGAAVGGTVPNITTVVTSVNKKAAAGLIPAGVLGLANQYPQLNELLDKHVLPQHRVEFFRARRQCFLADVAQFNSRDVVGMFDDPGLIYTNPTAVRIVGLNNPGQHTPKTPLFVYKSTGDEISPVEETDTLVATYCAGGATVEYQRDIASDHQSLAILAAAKALSWLVGVMNGTNDQRGCTTDTVISSLLDPAALEVIPKIIIDLLLDLLGKPVGPIIG